jgi:hypothetical protein
MMSLLSLRNLAGVVEVVVDIQSCVESMSRLRRPFTEETVSSSVVAFPFAVDSEPTGSGFRHGFNKTKKKI